MPPNLTTIPYTIRGIELDASGSVSPGWFARILEHTRWQVFTMDDFALRNRMEGGVARAGTYEYGVPLTYQDELEIATWVTRVGRTSLDFNFNIAQNFNSFEEFPDNFNNEKDASITPGRFPIKANIGQPIGSFYGFRNLGVWASDEDVVAYNQDGEVLMDIYGNPVPLSYKGDYEFKGGDAKYEDINHDGKIDLNDVVYLGDSNPKVMGGFGTAFSWKQFFISAQFLYRMGFQIVNMVAVDTEGMDDRNNQSKAVLHRWTYQGQDEPGMLPRAYYQHQANNLGSDRYVEDGDFLRLNHLTLRYSLRRELCQRLKIKSFDVAVTMRKLLTFTNYSGADPEVAQISDDPFWIGADRARTPPPKSFMLSIAIGF